MMRLAWLKFQICLSKRTKGLNLPVAYVDNGVGTERYVLRQDCWVEIRSLTHKSKPHYVPGIFCDRELMKKLSEQLIKKEAANV